MCLVLQQSTIKMISKKNNHHQTKNQKQLKMATAQFMFVGVCDCLCFDYVSIYKYQWI